MQRVLSDVCHDSRIKVLKKVESAMFGVIYKITNTENNKVYIGKTVKDFNRRYPSHGEGVERVYNYHKKQKQYGLRYNNHLLSSIEKYGLDKWEVDEVFDTAHSEEELSVKEIHWISHYKSSDDKFGYNKTLGGEGALGYKHTEEAKELMSKQRKGRVMSQEWIDKSAKTRIERGSAKGENNGMYGKTGKDNPKSKPIIMLDFKGDKVKEFESGQEVNRYLDKPKSNSAISKVCLNGGTAYNYLWLFKEDYIKLIEEDRFDEWLLKTKERYIHRSVKSEMSKMRNNSKPIYQLNKDTLEIIKEFESVALASKSTGISSQLISRVCNHGSNTTGGYSWVYVEEYKTLSKDDLVKLYSRKPSEVKFDRSYAKRRVICTTTGEVFESIKCAIERYGMSKGSKIHEVCNGKRKTCGKHPATNVGLEWRYA